MTVPPGYQQPYYGQPYQSPYPTDPDDAPRFGTSFGAALGLFLRKYARFTGRASLSEYWWMQLWNVLLSLLISIASLVVLVPSFVGIAQSGAFEGFRSGTEVSAELNQQQVWALLGGLLGFWILIVAAFLIGIVLIVPSLALTVRRLHDSDKSGHFAWLCLVPSVGSLIVLVLCLLPSDPRGQRFDRPASARAAV